VSKRTKWLLSIGVIAALVVGWQIVAFAGTVGTNQGFEDDDGNLIDNNATNPPNTAGIDWNTFKPAVTWLPAPATTPTREADAANASGYQFKGIEDWQVTTDDTGFAGGVKQDDECPEVITAKAPNKDDLKRIYLASKTADVTVPDTSTPDPNDTKIESHTFLNLAWVRIPQNTTASSAHVAFEFNKNTEASGLCPEENNADGLVERTAGDLLIVYDFEGGGTPVISLSRWVTSGSCEVGSNAPPCWGPEDTLTAGEAEAQVFQPGRTRPPTTTPDDLAPPALTSTTGAPVTEQLGDKEFGEAGIDLTASGVFTAGSCESFGTAFAVSRTSGQSSDAQMKDLVGPAPFTLQNCGTVNIIKQTSPRGLDQNFSFTTNLAGSQLSCDETLSGTLPNRTFTLNDTGNTGKTLGSAADAQNSDGNTQNCLNVPAGSYTVTEGADPTGFTFNDVSCTPSTGASRGEQDATNPRQANITLAGGGTVTCIFVNDQDKQSVLNTAQGFIPQDTASITGTGLTFDGSVSFKLLKGTLGDTTGETCANTTDTVVYEQTVANNALGNPNSTPPSRTATTTNPGGDPTTSSTTDGYTILDGASEGAYYWKVFYDGITDPDVTSCNENSTVTIDNGSEVKNPPVL
jgi:hypothetical protein